MSYCTLDEAFGNTYLNEQKLVNPNINRNNNLNTLNFYLKKSKIKKKKN